jgi:hypothetical protein
MGHCRKSCRWVGLGAALLAWCASGLVGPALASTSVEVPAGTLAQRAAVDAATVAAPEQAASSPTEAFELPLLALLSFREAGRPGALQPATPLLGGTELAQIAAVQEATVNLPDSGYPLWGEQPVNQAHTQFLPPLAQRTPMTSTPWGGATRAVEQRYKLDIAGELALGTGTATYADREYQEFALSELLTSRSGKEYGSSQRYDVSHDYVNSGRLALGARQLFPQLLWQGDLELREEYADYTDRDASANDYKQGQFELRFTPEWDGGAWQAEARYKYRVRDYDAFSTRSYKLHDGLLRLQHEFNPQLAGEAYGRLTDYNYSYGSTRDNTRTATGGSFDWQPNAAWRVRAAVDNEEKTYSAADYRDYSQLGYEASAEYRPDGANTFEAKGVVRDHQRDNFPSASYDDARLGLRWQRVLSEKLEMELSAGERQKDYDTGADSDFDTHTWAAQFNCYPARDWNVYGTLGQDDYDYTNPARAFLRTQSELGARFGRGRWEARADWRRSDNVYAQATGRDYTRDDYLAEASWRLDGQRVRVYYGIGRLAQTDPASRNEYDETRCGAQWDFELDSQTKLALTYDYQERAYDVRDNIEDSRLEARLNFEL